MKTARTLLIVLALTVSAGMILGSEPAPSYSRDIEPLFLAACGNCHGAERPKKGLDLSAGRGRAALVGVASRSEPQFVLVKAGDPDGSYLWKKLEHATAKGKGMPRTLFGASKLPADQLAVIRAWIAAGAPE